MTYPKEETPIVKAVETGQPIVVEDIFGSESWFEQRLFQEGIRSSLVYPLEYQGKIIGTLNFDSKDVYCFSEKDLHFIGQIAPGLAISIQNVILLDEIRGSEEKYRAVVEGAHDGICVLGSDNRIKFANKGLAEICGYSLKELLGKDFRDLLNEESRGFMADRFDRRRRGEKLNPGFELEAFRKNGDIYNIEINARVMKDSEGRMDYIVFVKDVTEKKKMEEQLLQSEKLRALGEMASGVAHDFNNSLAAILGNTQLLLYSEHDEETREALKTIEKVAKDSAQTVKRLQEFTRKKARQEIFKLDINSAIRDVIEITKPKWKDGAQGKGIQIEVVSHLEDVPGVVGTVSEIREVITNILFNAIEAMPGGGKIEIRTSEKEESVYVRIVDTGVGISDENRKKIFEPFFTTKPFTNTGLGLSMSYGIIKRFGGEITVESKAGSGTTFTIVLPIAVAEKEETISNPSIKKGKQARILVIDDEETVRSVLSKMLSQVNHQVTVAMSGAEGVRLFQEKEFDMVLTDLGMPGMSGWEVCKSIKKIKPSIPVGMITGWGLEVNKSRKEEAGLDFVITKPFDFHQIVTVVSEKIESRASSLS
jgi:PAS domain S-box-containing protein